ncbi:O-antigen translocase [Aeromonas hydrophila]
MRRLLTVTAFTALLTLLRMVAGFIIAKVVAVYTGPTGMAMLGQVQSMVAMLNGLVTAPAGNGVVRFTAEHQANGYEACAPWWKAAIQWIGILLGVVIPLGFLLAKPLSIWLFGNPDYIWLVIISCCALPFSAANTLIASVINGQQQYRRYVIAGMISVCVTTVVMIGLVIKSNLHGALIAAAINSSISGLVMLIISLRQPWFKTRYWWGKTEHIHRKAIGGYVLMAVTSALTAPVALILIRNILVANVGWEVAGYWQAVWKISEAYLAVITMALGTYYLPRLSSLNNVTAIKAEIIGTAKIIMPLVAISAGGVYLCRDIAISLLFTSTFSPARELFSIQLVGDVIKIASWLVAYPMLSRGAVKWFVSTEIIFSLSFVILSWLFIVHIGVNGVNIAYALNYALYFLFFVVNFDKIAK